MGNPVTDRPKRQLFTLSDQSFEAPNYVDSSGRLFTRPANDVPLMFWPDGSWCHPGNTFIREQFERGLSRLNGGGSVAVASRQISHLLRFCWRRRIEILSLTDNDFTSFIGELIREPHSRRAGQKAREGTAVISIGRSCLQFLECVGRHSGSIDFLGENGRIRATRKVFEVTVREGRTTRKVKTVHYWDHHSLPEPSSPKVRLPISTANIEKLRKAIGPMSTTAHQRMRRHCVLKLLEITGVRRGEISLLKVEDVRRANQMSMPMLRVPTLKKRKSIPPARYVPISRGDINFIMQYIDVHRRSIVRRKLLDRSDHGFLLVNGINGQPFRPASITQEVKKLAKHAEIEEIACPHMFRHRFFTKLFVALIEHHQANSSDEFRRMLIDGESLKRKVLEWSGQSSIESLDHYIDLAFDEVGDYKRTYDLTNVGITLDSFRGTLEAEVQALNDGEAPILVARRLLTEIEALKQSLRLADSEA